MDSTARRKKRIAELEEIIARKDRLSDKEYLELLHEIRKNYSAKLAISSVQSTTTGTGAVVNIIDKVHWLIDSIDTKSIERPADDNVSVNVYFKTAPESVKPK